MVCLDLPCAEAFHSNDGHGYSVIYAQDTREPFNISGFNSLFEKCFIPIRDGLHQIAHFNSCLFLEGVTTFTHGVKSAGILYILVVDFTHTSQPII